MEEPSLAREIGKVAWLVAKVMGGGAALFGAVFFVFRDHPLIGISVLYGLIIAGMIVYVGWWTYNSKKKQREFWMSDEQRDPEWKEAQARRDKSA